MILKAHKAAFLRIYVLELPISFSTSEHKSRAISDEEMLPIVHRAKPTTNMLLWFKSLENGFSMASFVFQYVYMILLFQAVGDKSEYFCLFINQEHDAQVT